MPLLRNIGFLATCTGPGQDGIAEIRDAALVWLGDTLMWAGPERDLPAHYRGMDTFDAEGLMVIPGLIDCHTHLIFGGWRSDEFKRRLLGEDYRAIAASGGGIRKTMRQTRAADLESLVQAATRHLDGMMRLGVTTVECKTGYGLSLNAEVRQLDAARAADAVHPIRLVQTFLGAHAVPPEFDDGDAWIDHLIQNILPIISRRGDVRFADIFVEDGAFTPVQAKRYLQAARQMGLHVKLHVDQLHDGDGAALAAKMGAVSADHLEYVNEKGIQAMTESGTVAVSLPIASLVLAQPSMPARALIEAGVPVAVATDFNPGSAPSYDLHLAMWLACTFQRMTPAEALMGATHIAAKALQMEHEIGSLQPGLRADFALIDAPDVDHWLYHFRPGTCKAVWTGGKQADIGH